MKAVRLNGRAVHEVRCLGALPGEKTERCEAVFADGRRQPISKSDFQRLMAALEHKGYK